MNTSHLPPDGTYPPRILAPGVSIWLYDGETLDASGKSVIFRRAGGDFYAAPRPNAKHEPMLNGTPMIVERLLNDGDFVHCGKERYIFQADPVADWRSLLEGVVDGIQPYQPSKLLQKWVRFDPEGVSLDGGKTHARWQGIQYVEFISLVFNPTYLKVHLHSETGKAIMTATKLPRVLDNSDDVQQLVNGIVFNCPFQLSASSIGSVLVDAYASTVYEKLLRPAGEQAKPLPASIEFITGEDNRRYMRRFLLLLGCAALLIVSLLMALANMAKRGETDWARYFPAYFLASFITFAVVVVGLWAIMWIVLQLSRLFQTRIKKST